MKFLKKFNEELKSSTFRRAADGLDKYGHSDRGHYVRKWADKVEEDEKKEIWVEVKKKYEQFGTFRLDVTNQRTFTGDFHLFFEADYEAEDEMELIEENGGGEFWFGIGIIPADENTYDACEESSVMKILSNDFGAYSAFTIRFYFDVEGSSMKITSYEIGSYSYGITVRVHDRPSAGRFKWVSSSTSTSSRVSSRISTFISKW